MRDVACQYYVRDEKKIRRVKRFAIDGHFSAAVMGCGGSKAVQPGMPGGDRAAFFASLAKVDLTRDYSILVEASDAMWQPSSSGDGTLWSEAGVALECLVEQACKCDPDGITLYFFGSTFTKHEKIASPERPSCAATIAARPESISS